MQQRTFAGGFLMTSRECVDAALHFKCPGKTPIDINPTLSSYRSLKQYINFSDYTDPMPNLAMEVVPHPEFLSLLGIDCISVKLGKQKDLPVVLPESLVDEWGISWKLVRQARGEYYEATSHPLARASCRDLKEFPWPESRPMEKAEETHREADTLFHNTELALVGRFGGSILETATYLLGLEEWFVRVLTDQNFIRKLLETIADIYTSRDIVAVEAAG